MLAFAAMLMTIVVIIQLQQQELPLSSPLPVSNAIVNATTSPPSSIRCMNFYGLETDRVGLVCDWVHDYEWYLDTLQHDMMINTIRLPFSYEAVKAGKTELMTSIIDSCHRRKMRVILDWHRTWSSHQGPTPEENITLSEFTQTWIDVLIKFPTVYGVGIFNELQPPDAVYANALHRETITRIENRFPGKFVYFAGCPLWGGDCRGIDLMDMPTWNRTFVEIHHYFFRGNHTVQEWDALMPSKIPSDHWFIGELGWKQNVTEEREWAKNLLAYLSSRKIYDLCAWTIAHSADTNGWWEDDCVTFNRDKASLLTSFWDADPSLSQASHALLRGRTLFPAMDTSSSYHTYTLDTV